MTSTATVESGTRGRNWPAWAGGLLCLLAAGFAHRELLLLDPRAGVDVPLAADVESFFFEPSDTSPMLVIAIAGWLLYRRVPRLRRTAGHAGSLGVTLTMMGIGVVIFGWAVLTSAADLQAIALTLEGLAVAHAFGGLPAVRTLLLPALLMGFALPMPAPALNEVVWQFQLWTAQFAGFLLSLLGHPVLVSGDQILRSDQVFQIIEACSGLKTIETLSMLAILMVDLFGRRGWHGVLVIAAALPVAFVINGFRALTLIFNPHSDVAAIHNAQGIVMLLVGVLVLYALDAGLERVLPQRRAPRPDGAATITTSAEKTAWTVTAGSVALLAILSVALPAWSSTSLAGEPPSLALSGELDGWTGVDRAPDRMFMGLANLRDVVNREYLKGRDRVTVFVAVGGLGIRHRSFHSPKTALPTTGWIQEERRFEVRDGRSVEIQLLRRGTRRLLVYHWREGTGGFWSELVRSGLGLDWSPLRRTRVPLVIRLATPVSSGAAALAEGHARLATFEGLMAGPLKRMGAPRGGS